MIKAAIVGASGYSGAELMRLLASRADVTLEHVTAASSAGQRVDMLYPAFAGVSDLMFEEYNPRLLRDIDVVFVALPSGEAMKVVPELRETVGKVVDLSGDFRLPSARLYEEYYKHKHIAPAILGSAVYGLPELHRDSIAQANLIANPGCYPTGAILALLPALKNHVISPDGIVINALSGVSGAGRSSSVELSFTELNENIRAYKIGNHQHIPEIQSVLSRIAGHPVSVSFIPHLVPLTRGIYTTIHANLTGSVTTAELYSIYEAYYDSAPFVRMTRQIPHLQQVVRTNFCDINLTIEQRTSQLIIVSVIDNLVKGAAGQAIQNMNIMFNLPENRGLL